MDINIKQCLACTCYLFTGESYLINSEVLEQHSPSTKMSKMYNVLTRHIPHTFEPLDYTDVFDCWVNTKKSFDTVAPSSLALSCLKWYTALSQLTTGTIRSKLPRSEQEMFWLLDSIIDTLCDYLITDTDSYKDIALIGLPTTIKI